MKAMEGPLKSKVSSYVDQKGASTVLVCLAMVVLLGMAALAVDVGVLFANRIKMANATDAAVLAGVRELPANPSGAVNVASQYAGINTLKTGEAVFQVSADRKSITCQANRTMDLFFARVLGFDKKQLGVTATARISPMSGCYGVVPFGVADNNYTFGDVQALKFGATFVNPLPPGQYAPLALGGSGASIYTYNISNGNSSLIKVGDVIPVETGNMIGPTKQGIQDRVNGCHHSPPCTISSYHEGCSRILIVPLGYNSPEPGSNGKFTVTGFAAFLVTDAPDNGGQGEVIGTFIKYVAPGVSADNANDRGIYVAELVE
ncbi:MAG: TadE/TadG family type IV pilus assembly protein [Syntrophomonas sp.]